MKYDKFIAIALISTILLAGALTVLAGCTSTTQATTHQIDCNECTFKMIYNTNKKELEKGL